MKPWASLVAQTVKNPPAVCLQETQVRSLSWEDPLEKGMATHSSILAWRIPWIGEPGGLPSTGWQSQTGLSDSHNNAAREKPGRWSPGSQKKSTWLVRAVSVSHLSGVVFRSLGSPVSLVPARGQRVMVSGRPGTVTMKITRPGGHSRGTPTQIPALCLTEKRTTAPGGHTSCLR